VQFIDTRKNNQYLQDNERKRLHSIEMTLNVDFLNYCCLGYNDI